MLSQINLRLVNQSADANNSSYVIFQKNEAVDFGELAVAWRVVQNLGIGDYHPFTYSLQFDVSAKDAWGNFTPSMPAIDGQAYALSRSKSGDTLAPDGTAVNPYEVEVRNKLPQGSIDACIFRDGKLLATKTGLSPAQKAVFRFKPKIYIGAVSQIAEGAIIDSAILQSVNTELDLFGVSSADIVITGGGTGPNATAFQFQLANVV
ncbi:MAG: hypothetical protein H6739_18585 [Alphaproteobacteria bacterium]|nr:hypothetical protein [Alphaproteobacteria bacterium]